MKIYVVVFMAVGAFGSLEPAGYQPPLNRYIPANSGNGAAPSQRSQYLPPVEHESSNQYNSQASSFGPSQRNVDNQYLTPLNSRKNSNQGSSWNYLAPAIDQASSNQYSSSASANDASQRNVNNQYLTPLNSQQNSNQGPARNYLAPAIDEASSNQHSSSAPAIGAPQRNVNNQYLALFNSQQDSNQGSARNYLAPAIERASQNNPHSSSASSSSSSFSSPSYQSSPSSSGTSYSAPPSAHSTPKSSYSSPTKSYGGPPGSFSGMTDGNPTSQYLSPNTMQGYSSGRDYEHESEPANYNFEYQVNNEYGNDFGHKENRQDEKSYGIYSVLLPDGRKQIVEYEADEQGFRPKISYEEIGGGFKNAKNQNSQGPY